MSLYILLISDKEITIFIYFGFLINVGAPYIY